MHTVLTVVVCIIAYVILVSRLGAFLGFNDTNPKTGKPWPVRAPPPDDTH